MQFVVVVGLLAHSGARSGAVDSSISFRAASRPLA
jgi:hypothetical protein